MRLILIDPKMLELSVYEGIPHLLAPVVTDMKQAANALNWCVGEMERRYKLMSKLGVRNLAGYNKKIAEAEERGETAAQPLQPDARGARAAGAPAVHRGGDRRTGRPDDGGRQEDRGADRAPGAEGARLRHPPDPGHAAAQRGRDHRPDQGQHPDAHALPGVSSKIDCRTILDQMGAEALLGQGDMLYLPPGTGLPVRVHGAFVGDDEVHRVVEYLKQPGRAQLHRRHPRRRHARRRCRGRRGGRGRRRRRGRPDVRPGRGGRAAAPPRLDLAGAAPSAHRLQPRRAADRADGEVRAGVGHGHQRQPRHAGAASATNEAMRCCIGWRCCACCWPAAACGRAPTRWTRCASFVRDVKTRPAPASPRRSPRPTARKKTQLQRQLRVRAARTASASPTPSPTSS